MGKAISIILGLAVIVIVGLLIWRGTDDNIAQDNGNTTELNGIGGPEEGFDPVLEADTNGDGVVDELDIGEASEESKG